MIVRKLASALGQFTGHLQIANPCVKVGKQNFALLGYKVRYWPITVYIKEVQRLVKLSLTHTLKEPKISLFLRLMISGKTMGGFGSGRHSNRLKSDNCPKVEIHTLGEVGDTIALRYGEAITYVPVVRTECNYGGSRPWFSCPVCSRRVGVLYFWGRFACRTCLRIYYSSQSEDAFHRTIRRIGKIAVRLGGEYGFFPDKPPRMRWATYQRYMEHYLALDSMTGISLEMLFEWAE